MFRLVSSFLGNSNLSTAANDFRRSQEHSHPLQNTLHFQLSDQKVRGIEEIIGFISALILLAV